MQTPNLHSIDTTIGHVRGPKGDPGDTPEITVTDITGGHRLTITVGEEEPIVFDVMDGAKGDKGYKGDTGDDGVSPTITITNITGGHRVTITDAEHPLGQSIDVMDGEVTEEELDDVKNTLNHKADVIYDTASGDIASFPDGADGLPVKDLTVAIEPVQSGTGDPSPTNVRPISGWTGANVSRTGKNLVEDTYENCSVNSIGVVVNNQPSFDLHIAKVKAGVTYTITSNELFVGGFYTSKPTLGSQSYNNSRFADEPKTFVAPIDGYVAFRTAHEYATPQLEVGSSATTYESYNPESTTIPITFPDGTTVYGGTLELPSCVLTVDRAIVDLGALSWYLTGQNIFRASIPSKKYHTIESKGLVCSAYAYDYNLSADKTIGDSSSSDNIWVKDTSYTDAATFETAVSGVQLVYELATTQTYQLDPTEVITTLYGQNNIWADCGPSTVEYPADTKLYIQKINAPTDDDMIADANIASGKYFIVNNNLYLSTAAILAGDPIKPGTNCTLTNLAAALNAINT